MIEAKIMKDHAVMLSIKGDTHTCYKELLHLVVQTLNAFNLEVGDRKEPLSESVAGFGQQLVILATKAGKDLDQMQEELRR